jgi:hypothetical protein
MRAMYVPTPALSACATWLMAIAIAPAIEGGGTLTCYAAADSKLATLPLTQEHLRQLLKAWAAADRAGQGVLEIDD